MARNKGFFYASGVAVRGDDNEGTTKKGTKPKPKQSTQQATKKNNMKENVCKHCGRKGHARISHGQCLKNPKNTALENTHDNTSQKENKTHGTTIIDSSTTLGIQDSIRSNNSNTMADAPTTNNVNEHTFGTGTTTPSSSAPPLSTVKIVASLTTSPDHNSEGRPGKMFAGLTR